MFMVGTPAVNSVTDVFFEDVDLLGVGMLAATFSWRSWAPFPETLVSWNHSD